MLAKYLPCFLLLCISQQLLVLAAKPAINKQQRVQLITKSIPNLGKVRGRIINTRWTQQKVAQFLDIPYGKSPTGPLRFKPSLPVEPWSGVLNAFRPNLACPSVENLSKFTAIENAHKLNLENCLRLTVTTQKFTGASPVMVYIHGDFLYDGHGKEAMPNYLLEQDVVLVSVNYRLGPFGFLSTMTQDIPGNAAVNDIILALEWIQKHIAAFGGDPKRVTLFGQTGGAALINALTLSPQVPENLFQRVIYQSASAMTPFFTTNNPIPAAKDIGKRAGCKNTNKIEALNKCLRRLNTTQLLTAFKQHMEENSVMGVGNSGAAQLVIGGPSYILPDHPGKLLLADNYKAYPTLGGTTKNAGSYILKDIYLNLFNESVVDDIYNGLEYVQFIIQQTNGADPMGAWTKFAKMELLGGEINKNATFYDLIPGLIDLSSTIAFKNPLLLVMQSNAKHLPNDTFLYSFDYRGEINRYSDDINDRVDESIMPFEMGVSLTDENLYLFPWPSQNALTSVRDNKIAKQMVALWTSFAATGKPQAAGLSEWPSMTSETGPYLKIGETMTIGNNYLDEYNVTVRDAAKGYNLVNEDFFANLVDVDPTRSTLELEVASYEEDMQDNEDLVFDLQAARGGNLIFIATNRRQ